jgi:hypothetical protein
MMTDPGSTQMTAESTEMMEIEPLDSLSTSRLDIECSDNDINQSNPIAKSQTKASDTTVTEHCPPAEVRKWSIYDNAGEQQPQGIYWRSPLSMLSSFLFGLLACVGHQLYYSHLDKKVVGNDSEQQWALRLIHASQNCTIMLTRDIGLEPLLLILLKSVLFAPLDWL